MYALRNRSKVLIRQIHEIAEWIGFETRNKYEILDEENKLIGFAAEQGKGFLGLIMRQFFGHWRTFEIFFFDNERRPVFKAIHPFRWFFQCLVVQNEVGKTLGIIESRFSLFFKSFVVMTPEHKLLLEVRSPVWKIWTFSFKFQNLEKAVVNKKWSGILSESFTDRDNFLVEFMDPKLTDLERNLVLAAGLFIDLQYFEKKK